MSTSRLRSLFCIFLLLVAAASAQSPVADELTKVRKENQQLREENQRLRQLLIQRQAPATVPLERAPAAAPSSASSPQSQALTHWMTTSSSKRHNSRCRFYRTSNGRACGPNDGIACKICGG
jgi:hypothetical protein